VHDVCGELLDLERLSAVINGAQVSAASTRTTFSVSRKLSARLSSAK
jgi:hypothetical protein